MVPQSKQIIILLLFGFTLFNEVQAGLHLVYPLGIDEINPKFLSRKLDSDDSNDRNVFNKSHLHLIYPVNENLVIMTPMPMEEYEERILEATTEGPKPLADEITSRLVPTTDIPDEATEFPELETLRMDLETATMVSDDMDSSTDTTPTDTDTATDTITTTTDSESPLLSIYDTNGPTKLLRKRVADIKGTSTSPLAKYRKRFNHFTTAAPPSKESLSSVKKVTDGAGMDRTSERKRYTYKKWFTPPKKNKDEGSDASETTKKETDAGEHTAENRQ